jgi:F-type H+-transporting ATPase subunit a
MEGFNLFEQHYLQPFKPFGFTHPFFNIERDTVLTTWLILVIILCVGLPVKSILKRSANSPARTIILSFIDGFRRTTIQTLEHFSLKHFSFITALFVFIILCNTISLIPGAEEPTKSLNTTVALGIISFLYIQYYAIKAQGAVGYLKEYFTPLFIFLPLNVIGKIATIISMSFRLYGNVFGGATISMIYFHFIYGSPFFEAFGSFSGLNLLLTCFFILFEGTIQAFVFAMLSLTYLAAAIMPDPLDQKAE